MLELLAVAASTSVEKVATIVGLAGMVVGAIAPFISISSATRVCSVKAVGSFLQLFIPERNTIARIRVLR
jgi:CheY-specific phosphatase CheX